MRILQLDSPGAVHERRWHLLSRRVGLGRRDSPLRFHADPEPCEWGKELPLP